MVPNSYFNMHAMKTHTTTTHKKFDTYFGVCFVGDMYDAIK